MSKNIIKNSGDNRVLAEVGKWFMDVAKYVTTVGIIAAVLSQYHDSDMRTFFVIGGTIVVVTFITGLLFFIKSKK
ncbi:MAG: hypothetical protein LBQ31_05330 [Bacteroidales bacterium]|jgi:hypothetical protein|nr:hypothetical protein [Bacteroidales bacterium]